MPCMKSKKGYGKGKGMFNVMIKQEPSMPDKSMPKMMKKDKKKYSNY